MYGTNAPAVRCIVRSRSLQSPSAPMHLAPRTLFSPPRSAADCCLRNVHPHFSLLRLLLTFLHVHRTHALRAVSPLRRFLLQLVGILLEDIVTKQLRVEVSEQQHTFYCQELGTLLMCLIHIFKSGRCAGQHPSQPPGQPPTGAAPQSATLKMFIGDTRNPQGFLLVNTRVATMFSLPSYVITNEKDGEPKRDVAGGQPCIKHRQRPVCVRTVSSECFLEESCALTE